MRTNPLGTPIYTHTLRSAQYPLDKTKSRVRGSYHSGLRSLTTMETTHNTREGGASLSPVVAGTPVTMSTLTSDLGQTHHPSPRGLDRGSPRRPRRCTVVITPPPPTVLGHGISRCHVHWGGNRRCGRIAAPRSGYRSPCLGSSREVISSCSFVTLAPEPYRSISYHGHSLTCPYSHPIGQDRGETPCLWTRRSARDGAERGPWGRWRRGRWHMSTAQVPQQHA